jgi:hypothetical protein
MRQKRHKKEFGQTYCQDPLTKILNKFISYFFQYLIYDIRILEVCDIFWKSLNPKRKVKSENSTRPAIRPKASAQWGELADRSMPTAPCGHIEGGHRALQPPVGAAGAAHRRPPGRRDLHSHDQGATGRRSV